MALGQMAGLNVTVDPEVDGVVSLLLHDVTIEEALSILAAQVGAAYTISGQLLSVTPLAKAAGKAEARADDGFVRVYALQYAEVTKVIEMASIIAPNLKLSGDEKSNRLVAVGSKEDLEIFEGFLQLFDKAGRQVLIEARVEEISHNALRRLGLNWTLPDLTGAINTATGGLNWTLSNLQSAIDAMETRGEAKLLAKPLITTVSGETAPIFVGDRVPVIISGGAEEGDTMTYIEAGIRLQINARIAASDEITVNVALEVSSILEWSPQGMPVVRTRNAETTVQVYNGQPIIIGGLIREEEQKSMSRIPLISSLPIVGSLFRWNRSNVDQMETVIILTPHLIEDTRQAGTLSEIIDAANANPAPSSPPYAQGVAQPETVNKATEEERDGEGARKGESEKEEAAPLAETEGEPSPASPASAAEAEKSVSSSHAPLYFRTGITTNFTSYSNWLAALGFGGGKKQGETEQWYGAVASYTAALSSPAPAKDEYRLGAMYRLGYENDFLYLAGYYLPGAGGALSHHWEAELGVGLKMNLPFSRKPPLVLEPTLRIGIPLGTGTNAAYINAGVMVGYNR
ncbi:MAG TPA: hypothetical protein GXX29_02035 [Firmicutes bacterium]|nr:hypothetical protein [Bacillota bacterium]